MNLAEKLDGIRTASSKQIPEEKRAIMTRATADLRASGILDRAIKVGDKLPSFDLPNQNGEHVRSTNLLAQGPLVLTIFRGHW
jgi:hypothetical protein